MENGNRPGPGWREPAIGTAGIELGLWARTVWRRKWLLAACVTAPLLLGLVYLSQAERVYEVAARLLVQKRQLPLRDEGRPNRHEDQDFLATQVEIIRSPVVVHRACATLGLETVPGHPEANPVVWVLGRLKAANVLGTNVLSLKFEGPDPEQGIRLINAIVASYREYLGELEQGNHTEVLRTLAESERELRADLNNLQEEYQQIHKESPLVGEGPDAVRVQRDLLSHLAQTLADVRSRRMELENQVAMLATPDGGDVAGRNENTQAGTDPLRTLLVTTTPWFHSNDLPWLRTLPGEPAELTKTVRSMRAGLEEIGRTQQALFEAQAEENALAQQLGPKHPQLRAARQRVTVWDQLLSDQLNAIPKHLEQVLTSVRQHEGQLEQLYEQELAKAKSLDHHVLKQQQLQDGISRLRAMHDSVLTQLKQWQLADRALADGRLNVLVRKLEEPGLVQDPVWPQAVLVLVACGLVGLVGGLGLIGLLHRQQVRTPAHQPVGRVCNPSPGQVSNLSHHDCLGDRLATCPTVIGQQADPLVKGTD